jgi:hypothetical protein
MRCADPEPPLPTLPGFGMGIAGTGRRATCRVAVDRENGETTLKVFTGGEAMPVIFPHANHHTIADVAFRDAWLEHCQTLGAGGEGLELPRLSSRKPMADLEDNNSLFSLEFLLRTMVPTAYRDVAQATWPFLRRNAHIVAPTTHPVVNPATGRLVQGVRLLPEAAVE